MANSKGFTKTEGQLHDNPNRSKSAIFLRQKANKQVQV